MKIAIIGAGSVYTPELILRLSQMPREIPVTEISLMDIDENRLAVMHGFCGRYAAALGYGVTITKTAELRRAVDGAAFVVTQLRVGGNKARVFDEKIPLSHGLVGQETTGAGGFMKALRTVPVMAEIGRTVAELAPDAWIVNYTNPTGIVAEGVIKASGAKIAGLCSGGLFPADYTAQALGVPRERVRYDYAGLNHMNFAYNITVSGRPLTKEEMDKVCEQVGGVDAGLLKKIGAVSSPYLQYFFHTGEKVKHMSESPTTRAEDVLALEKEIYAGYADEQNSEVPPALYKRGGGGYSDVAVGFIGAIVNNKDTFLIVNLPNRGVLPFLPDDAVIETACYVNAGGIKAVTLEPPPKSVWGLIAAVKNYEQLAVEAALTGDKDTALLALTAHPLVRDYDTARILLDEMLAANRPYLPLFFSDSRG